MNQQTDKPDIIGTVEVKAKNCKELPQISEFSFTIKGYDVHYVNIDRRDGRGIILYTAEWLKASPGNQDLPGLEESVWAAVRLTDNDKLLILAVCIEVRHHLPLGLTMRI